MMLVGKFLHGKNYSVIEYIEAIAIAQGVFLFKWGEISGKTEGKNNDSFFGFALVVLYLLSDAFTSQWQSHIFKLHRIDHYQVRIHTTT